jgi:hypothetical protein
MLTAATGGAGVTVIVAAADLPDALTVIVGVPTAAAVTVTAAPVLAETLA